MNWIRLSSEYFRHRKTLRIVGKLGPVAANYPLRLWLWAVEQSPSGDLRDLEPEELVTICDHKGDPSDLWDAMVACGFIEKNGRGWRIKSWEEHQLPLIERAEHERERWRRWYAKRKAEGAMPAAPEPEPESEPKASGKAKKAEPLKVPAALDTPRFLAAWEAWIAYRREARMRSWKPQTVAFKLRELAEWGEPAAVESIRQSIANGWQGLFAPKVGGAIPIAASAAPEKPRTERQRIEDLTVHAECRGATDAEGDAIYNSKTIDEALAAFAAFEARMAGDEQRGAA